MDIFSTLESLERILPELITEIAIKNKVPEYCQNPDFFDPRLKKWHQYGLLTHTKKVRQAYHHKLRSLLMQWGVCEKVDIKLSEVIGDLKKKDLFDASIMLHDLGKILCLGQEQRNREHEKVSANLLYKEPLKKQLDLYGFNAFHLGYLERCIATHDAVSKELRDELKDAGNLNLKTVCSERVKQSCRHLAKRYSSIDMSIEMGLFFVCDSLGKLDSNLSDSFPGDFSEDYVSKHLKERGLPEDLRFGIMQFPANLKLAETYLKSIEI